MNDSHYWFVWSIDNPWNKENLQAGDMSKKYSYDQECYELATHFYPDAPVEFLNDLAQALQDVVEYMEPKEVTLSEKTQ